MSRQRVKLAPYAVLQQRRRVRGERQRPALMVLLAVVALVNVAIWTLPDKRGQTPMEQELR